MQVSQSEQKILSSMVNPLYRSANHLLINIVNYSQLP